MALNNNFIMVENDYVMNEHNGFVNVKRTEDVRRTTKKVARDWKAKASRSAKRREQPLSRKPRKTPVVPRRKKKTPLAKNLLKKKIEKKKAKVKKMTNSWKAKASRTARMRTQPLPRRTLLVGPRGKKENSLSKKLLKKKTEKKMGIVTPKPHVTVPRYSEFVTKVVSEKLSKNGKSLRSLSKTVTPSNVNQPIKGKI